MECNQKRGSEFTQHTDCLHDPRRSCLPDLLPYSSDLWSSLNTLTTYWHSHTHIVRSEMSLLCFHITTEQNSQDASPVPPTHTISSQRKSFHSKLCTLLESTSLISIRCSENTGFPVLSALSLSRILLQQSLGQVLGTAESSSLAPSSPAANRTSPHSVLPRSLTSASSCSPSSYLVLLSFTMFRSLQNYPPDLFPRHQNLRWLPHEAFWKSSHSVPSITNRLPPLLTPPHQFGSIPSHYFQPSIPMNHSTHTNWEPTIHAISCSSNGVPQ